MNPNFGVSLKARIALAIIAASCIALLCVWESRDPRQGHAHLPAAGTAARISAHLPEFRQGHADPPAAGTACQAADRAAAPDAAPAAAVARQRLSEAHGRLPLSFEPNVGQFDERVRFVSRGKGYVLFLTPAETVLMLRRGSDAANDDAATQRHSRRPGAEGGRLDKEAVSVVRMHLAGGQQPTAMMGAEEQTGRTNYFFGKEPAAWRTGVVRFGKVRCENVYPGVDLVYYGNQSELEYDFVVAPGSDPGTIAMVYEGAERIELGGDGGLVLHLAGGDIRQSSPVVYQDDGGVRHAIPGHYVLRDDKSVGFAVGPYDKSRTLVIDPALAYATYLGGANADHVTGIAADSSGAAYVTGYTMSTDFPVTAGVYTASNDVFVTKLDPTGTTLVYSTYVGGTGDDEGMAIAVDGVGAAYVTGLTTSADFPPMSAMQSVFGGGTYDAFIFELDSTGSGLVYSTFFGGTGDEIGFGIAVDAAGNAYITGLTTSPPLSATTAPLPTVAPYQAALSGPQDAFAAQFDAAGSIVYSTYLGGTGSEYGKAIAVDSAGNAYVTGATDSTDFPTTVGAFQTSHALTTPPAGANDAFVTKLSWNGTALTLAYSTYLGGGDDDYGEAIAVDASGAMYVGGETLSADFPTATPFQAANLGGYDAFVTKIDTTVPLSLVYSTYLGGTGSEFVGGIAVDGAGHPYVMGDTASTGFPTAAPFQAANAGGSDVFVTEFASGGDALVYSSYLGGAGDETGHGIALDPLGNAYVAGDTTSSVAVPPGFPTVAPFQADNAGGSDAFVAKVVHGPTVVSFSPPNGATNVGPNAQLVITFSENISANTGYINIMQVGTPDVLFEQIPVASVSVVNNPAVTIPHASFITTGSYYVLIDGTAFKDTAGFAYTGIADTTTWAFTVDATPPTATYAPNGTTVGGNTTLVITFSENVVAATGNIVILQAGNPVQTIPALSANAVVSDNIATITPPALLASGPYYVHIDAGAFKDLAGNPFAGIADNVTWAFTVDASPVLATAFTPVNNAVEVSPYANLQITFNKNVFAGLGDIVIYTYADDIVFQVYSAAYTPEVTIAGNVVTIAAPTHPTRFQTAKYYVLIDPNAFQDSLGNNITGNITTDKDAWAFTVDATPPAIVSLSPANGATEVAPTATLSVTFTKNIVTGSGGNITIKRKADNSVFETIPVTSANVTTSGTVATITPPVPFTTDTFYVEIDATCLQDPLGNPFPGITGAATWSFTADATPPVITGLDPANGSTDATTDTDMDVSFSKNILKGTSGNITIKRADGSVFETIAVTSSNVEISGNVATITPPVAFTAGAYYVEIDATCFQDALGNFFLGISGPSTWSFTLSATRPVANAQSLTTFESTPLAITLTGSDPQSKPLSFTIATTPAHGSLSNLDAATGAITYTPATAYQGQDSFTFTVSNGTATSAAATVSIDVQPSAAPAAQPLTVLRLSGKIFFPAGGKDSIKVSGTLVPPAGFTPSGQTVDLNVNGAKASGTMDPKGRIKAGTFTFTLKTTKKGTSYSAMLKSGTWADAWAAAGCTNADAKKKSVVLDVQLNLGGTHLYEGTKTGSWTAKAGASGSLK
ncbi:MAG: Ig-like domain-containing protein [Planctomycetota bacterium]|nr:Ig-like domain-containing protein [Planctomycetota bacterium]